MTDDHLSVAGPAVFLSGRWVELCWHAVQLAGRHRARNGLPDTDANRHLAAALHAAMSACRRTDGPKPAAAQTDSRWLTTAKVAEMLDCTERHASRLAPYLDGEKSAGRWFIPEHAVIEHLEGTTE